MPSDPDLLATPLRYFIQVAEHKSFTRAAEELRVSQPSLSVAIKKLEDALSTPLFLRGQKGVSLTRAGKILLDHVRQADRTLAAACEELLALETDPRGTFVIGAHESLAAYTLPTFMARFLGRYPRVELSLFNGNSREIEAKVLAREIDLGLVVNPTRHPDSVLAELFEDQVGFVASATLARKAKGDPRRLIEAVPLIHVPELKQTQFLLAAIASDGVAAPSYLTCSSMELVKSLVLDGVGVGILPHRVASYGVSRGRLVHLGDRLPVFRDVIALIRRFDLPMTAGSRALFDELRAHGEAMPPLPEVLRSFPVRRARARET